ncbi:MAG TPA: hypothetical protein DCG06_06670 [Deltaproteobacteria bacterium]|nr:hypothetical protein [Deltaproteobacteria bacterium]
MDVDLATIFNAPVLVDQAARVAETRKMPKRAIVRADRSGRLQLSSGQERVWFLDQLDPGDASYNVPVAIRIEGLLDRGALEEALLQVLRRHEVLRTTVASDEGVARPVVHEVTEVSVPEEDLMAATGVESALVKRLAEEAAMPFDLASDFPIRARLLRVDKDSVVVCLTLSHVAADGWSMGILVRDLLAFYHGAVEGAPQTFRRSRASTSTTRSGSENRNCRAIWGMTSPTGGIVSTLLPSRNFCIPISRVRRFLHAEVAG